MQSSGCPRAASQVFGRHERSAPPRGGELLAGEEPRCLLRSLRNHPGDFQLALIGAPSPEHPDLAEAVARLASEDPRVHLLGPCTSETVAAAMDEADVFLLPSLAEATPLVLLEAMS